MQDGKAQAGKNAAGSGEGTASGAAPRRALNWTRQVGRPTASVLAVALALLLVWHGVNGKNGLRAWEQKRAEERALHKEIDDLQQENTRLRERIERLKTNPDAIGQVAREQLHYAKPNEVIVQLPPEKKTQTQTAGAGK
jgi:cell division protein FtsB